jgi:phosphate-selective porin
LLPLRVPHEIRGRGRLIAKEALVVFGDRWLVHCALAVVGVLAPAVTGFAQVDPMAGGDEQTADAAPAQPAQKAAKKKKQDAWEVRWNPQPTVRFGKDVRIDFHARYQWDDRNSEDGSSEAAAWSRDLEKHRVGIDGTVAGKFDFQIEREIAGVDPWRDVFVNYSQFAAAQVQAGKFKLPLGMEENTSVANLDFAYRSLASNQLAPGRDQGLMMHGRVLNRMVRYEVGVFDHDGRNGRTSNTEKVFGGRTVATRFTIQPFRAARSSASDLQFGVAVTSSDVPLGLSSLRGESVLGEVFYTSPQNVQGTRRRMAFEGRWRPGPFSVKSEYIRVTTERLGQSVEDTDLAPLVADGWYVSGTWAVTGDRKAHGLDNPRRPLFRGGIGAIELAMRVEKLTFGSAAHDEEPSDGPRAAVVDGSADRATTFGVNWYVNRWVKLQWNAIREDITHQTTTLPESSSWSRVFRVQLAF